MRRAAVPRQDATRARHEAGIAALAAALAANAAGERVRAIEALAAMVMNRLAAARSRRAPAWWGVDLAAAVASPGVFPDPPAPAHDAALLAACRRIAARAASGALPDPTGGAIAWHRAGAERPADAPGGDAVRIGGLVFLRVAEAPEPEKSGPEAA